MAWQIQSKAINQMFESSNDFCTIVMYFDASLTYIFSIIFTFWKLCIVNNLRLVSNQPLNQLANN